MTACSYQYEQVTSWLTFLMKYFEKPFPLTQSGFRFVKTWSVLRYVWSVLSYIWSVLRYVWSVLSYIWSVLLSGRMSQLIMISEVKEYSFYKMIIDNTLWNKMKRWSAWRICLDNNQDTITDQLAPHPDDHQHLKSAAVCNRYQRGFSGDCKLCFAS